MILGVGFKIISIMGMKAEVYTLGVELKEIGYLK
jgi:hypothetical protein